MRNLSVPDSAFSNGRGTFRTQLPLRRDRRFILTMSDATGLVSGGTSELKVVAPPPPNVGCNTTEPNVDFFFSLDTELEQCKPYPFTLYTNASQPITIIGAIPGGQSFVLHPPEGPSYNWTANVAAGTPIIFTMIDSLGRNGGTADIRLVRITNDTSRSCLDASVTPMPSTSGPRKLSAGVIAAIVICVVLGLASLPVVAILFIRYERRRSAQNDPRASNHVIDLTGGMSSAASSVRPGMSSANEQSSVHTPQPQPFMLTTRDPIRSSSNSSTPNRTLSKVSQPRVDSGSTTLETTIRSGGPSRTSTQHSRVILHSDMEEVEDVEPGEVVELPPQYFDRRGNSGYTSVESSSRGTSFSKRAQMIHNQ
ncbi:hypothetical protein AB1N83_001178 [Pleurotus pulmonarius]